MVHLLWESNAQHAGMEDTMKRKRHTPEQIVRKLREGDRMLNEGTDLTEVCCAISRCRSRRGHAGAPSTAA